MVGYFGPVLPCDVSPDGDPEDDYRYGDYQAVDLEPADEIMAAEIAGVPLGQQLVEAQEEVAWAERALTRRDTPMNRRKLDRAQQKLALLEQALDLGRAA